MVNESWTSLNSVNLNQSWHIRNEWTCSVPCVSIATRLVSYGPDETEEGEEKEEEEEEEAAGEDEELSEVQVCTQGGIIMFTNNAR